MRGNWKIRWHRVPQKYRTTVLRYSFLNFAVKNKKGLGVLAGYDVSDSLNVGYDLRMTYMISALLDS